MIHSEAEKIFNKKAYELISLIAEGSINDSPQILEGSLASKIAVDMSEKLVPEPGILSDIDYKHSIQSIFEE